MKHTVCFENKTICHKAKMASTTLDRMIGLMFKNKMQGFDGLIITPCNSIHTCFMKYELDIVFLNKKDEIVKIRRSMKPWRVTGLYFKANKVLELDGGSLDKDLCVGDKLEIKCIN